MRKAKEPPSFHQYFEKLADNQPLDLVLRGHLVVEALLVEIVQLTRPGDVVWRWNFGEKLQHCVTQGYIPVVQAACYNRLNDIRNDFAHILGHRLTYDELFQYAREMAAAGFDFSEDSVYADRQRSEEWYGYEGCMLEILNNLSIQLAMTLHEKGGPDRMD